MRSGKYIFAMLTALFVLLGTIVPAFFAVAVVSGFAALDCIVLQERD